MFIFSTERISLFTKKQELLSLSVPIVFYLVFLVELCVGSWHTIGNDSLLYLFLAIFGTSHTLFTYFVVGYTFEGRSLIFDLFRRSWKMLPVCLLLIAFLIGYFVCVETHFDTESWPMQTAKIFVIFLFGQHGLGQVRGMSILYNRMAEQQRSYSQKQRMEAYRLEKIERYMHLALVITFLFQIYSKEFLKFNMTLVIGSIMMALVTIILFIASRYPYASSSNKTLFLTRLFMLPLIIMIPESFAGMFIVHGLEYQQLTAKMFNNSRTKLIGLYGILMFAIFVILFPVLRNSHLQQLYFPLPVALSIAVLSQVIDHFHYFSDAFIFRFSLEPVRRNIGGLLPLR